LAQLWVNHNWMLATTPDVRVKTGWTTRAGGCLIAAVKRGDRAVIGVVLDSPSIWTDMATLLDVAFNRE
jgi:D-alanyl-D-alanine carboxypeptidase